jgi:hypothetical protein
VDELLTFYRQPSPTSELGRRPSALPADAAELAAIVRGLLVHNFTAETQALDHPADRMAHMETVGAAAILDNVLGLDPSPLDRERPIEDRMVGFCYHFALLHCALLRATGTPARVRCGFAGYFAADRWIDHWVVEHWYGTGWQLTDPQTGRTGMTADDFQDGVTAWLRCRDDPARSTAYGNGMLWGWDELRGSLINDVAALAKVEVAGWYWCDRLQVDPLDQPHPALDATLDVLARSASAADSVATIEKAFHLHPDLQPPPGAVAR